MMRLSWDISRVEKKVFRSKSEREGSLQCYSQSGCTVMRLYSRGGQSLADKVEHDTLV